MIFVFFFCRLNEKKTSDLIIYVAGNLFPHFAERLAINREQKYSSYVLRGILITKGTDVSGARPTKKNKFCLKL